MLVWARPVAIVSAFTLWALVAAGGAPALEDRADTLSAFLARYRCEVADRLRRAHDYGDPSVERDRYLIIDLKGHRGVYVQCVFRDGITHFACEAASGYFLDAPGTRTMVLAPPALAALGRLGFTTVEHEDNFHQTISVPATPDYAVLATLMLRTLHDAYGARADSTLGFDAPHAPEDPAACRPAG